jgi:hypothetical protein
MVIMRNFLTTFFIASVLSTACLAQEPSAPAPVAPPTAAGKPARITLDMEKVQFMGNDDVVLNITFENTGTTPLNLVRGRIETFYEFDVIDTEGKKVPFFPNFNIVGSRARGFDLAPGNKVLGWVYLNRIVDFSKSSKYAVKVFKKIHSDGEPNTDKDDADVTVTSEPLNFEIVSRPKFGDWGPYKKP